MWLSESYKSRILELAGLEDNQYGFVILEAEIDPYSNSSNRVKFDINLMKQAIEQGREVGMVFQSDNVKYKMPTWKQRIIYPFAIGYDKKGQLVFRAVHIEGQSEKKALEFTPRKGSAMASNEWRLFKAANVKSMWFTGRFFQSKPAGVSGDYNPNDSAMKTIIASFDPAKAKAYQDSIKQAPEVEKEPVEVPQTATVKTPTTTATKTQAKPEISKQKAKQPVVKKQAVQPKVPKLPKTNKPGGDISGNKI